MCIYIYIYTSWTCFLGCNSLFIDTCPDSDLLASASCLATVQRLASDTTCAARHAEAPVALASSCLTKEQGISGSRWRGSSKHAGHRFHKKGYLKRLNHWMNPQITSESIHFWVDKLVGDPKASEGWYVKLHRLLLLRRCIDQIHLQWHSCLDDNSNNRGNMSFLNLWSPKCLG